MKKLVTLSSLLLVLAACGSQVVEFPEQGGSTDDGPDASNPYPPFGDVADSGAPDADADAPDSNTPDASDDADAGDDSGTPDSGKPDSGKPDGGNQCNNSCCENKCDSILIGCKAKCEKECTGMAKTKCLYQCECEHDSCVKCCK